MFRLGALLALLFVAVASAAAQERGVHGRVTDPDALPLPGVVVTLTNDSVAGAPVVGVTDERGDYWLDAPPGRYRLTVELAGFATAERTVAVGADGVVLDVGLSLAAFEDNVTVHAELAPSLIAVPQPNAPATIARVVIDNAMLRNSRYEDVLTLMPNVVRGPNDEMSIGGAPASTGALVVDGVNETDPVSGQPGVVVPLDAVESVDVRTGGYSAEVGPATGGVTSIHTRAGTDQWHTSMDSLFPRLLIENGSVDGIEYWEPNVGVSGPIVKGRLFFDQAVSYRRDRNPFVTLAGPERNLYNQPLSWSQLDANVSSSQHLRLAVGITGQHTDRANITAFTPAASAPSLTEDGWSVTLADRVSLARSATLELHASVLTTISEVAPIGEESYRLGHELATGSYFDHRSSHGRRLEVGAAWSFTPSARQLMKVGATIDQASLDQADEAAPVLLLRSDDTVSRRVSFSAAAAAAVETSEVGVFAQDAWSARPWLVLDAGLRYDRLGAIAAGTLSPRVAWTLKRGDRTSVSGSAGLFADKLLLGALAFPALASRTVETFTVSGAPSSAPVAYENRVDGPLRIPTALRWDVGVDRTFGRWQAHVRYQERHGRGELLIDPVEESLTSGALLLSSRGRSMAQNVEATIGYHRPGGDEVYMSYVRTSAHGDLNTFDGAEGLFRDPFVQSNQYGVLPAAVPTRILAWGLLHVPGQFTLAPFVEIRDGFPFAPIDDDWVDVGARNGVRMPRFGSLDLSITRVVDLPRRLPHARVGLKFYNLVSVNTEREVQRDVDSPNYGRGYDPISRDFAFVCTFLMRHR